MSASAKIDPALESIELWAQGKDLAQLRSCIDGKEIELRSVKNRFDSLAAEITYLQDLVAKGGANDLLAIEQWSAGKSVEQILKVIDSKALEALGIERAMNARRLEVGPLHQRDFSFTRDQRRIAMLNREVAYLQTRIESPALT